MNIKRNIIFSLENRKKDGKLITVNIPIRMRVIYDGGRVDFSTGYRVDASKWEENIRRMKKGCSNKLKQSASEINTELSRYETIIQSLFKEAEIQEKTPSPELLKRSFNSKIKRETAPKACDKGNSFFEIFKLFLKEGNLHNNWSEGTNEKFAATVKHLTDYNPLIEFEDFNDKTLSDYLTFLQNKKNLRNVSLSKQLNLLKWFLRWASKKGYHENNRFEIFKPKLKQTSKTVIFLTWEELDKLRNYQLAPSQQYLERARDLFLFCCFTGIRYSDLFNLKRSDIKDTYIEITTIKTADNLIIELNVHSRRILEKYKHAHLEGDKALPVISNQKMNDYIKELAELAEIDAPVRETYYRGNKRFDEVLPKYTLLSTHAGRRTFICNALSLGIPAQVVMKWTGHSDYKAMKPYIDVADDIRASAMSKFNQL